LFFCLAYIRGASGVMYGPGEEDSPLSIDENGLSVVGDRSVRRQTRSEEAEEQEQQFGKRGCFHVGLCGRERKKLKMSNVGWLIF